MPEIADVSGTAALAICESLLLALKGSAVILLRLGRLDEARLRLAKIAEVDERDALGAAPLLAVIDARLQETAEEIS